MATRRDAAWVARHLGRAEAALFAESDLQLLERSLKRRDLESGRVLFRQGTTPKGVWIIQSGWVALVSGPDSQRGLIGVFGPRQCVGDVPLLLGTPAPYSARALLDCSCLFLGAADFQRILERNGKVAARWASKLAGAIARTQGRVVELLGQSLHERLARVLLHEGEHGRLPFSQEVCAALVGASRPSVNQALKQLERQGIVELSYGQIEVIDRKKVNAIAGGQMEERAR